MKHQPRVHLAKAKHAESHEAGKYSASLADLEASAHVPVDEQVAIQPETPAQAPLSDGEVERQSMLRVTGGA
ncbi:MAG TPA: hypothetical protein VHX15_16790 [Frankiaceae bacterium]|jgi:hypothetical protein|nr:hypothetical protein [Frankiaceae bacterium]